MRRLCILGALASLYACAGGNQYSVTAQRPIATTEQVVLSGEDPPPSSAPASDPAPPLIFASQQVITLGLGQSYIYGGVPGETIPGLLGTVTPVGLDRGLLSGGLANALVPSDRVVISLGLVSVGVQPGSPQGLGGTVTIGTSTPAGGLGGTVGNVGSTAGTTVGSVGSTVGSTVGTVGTTVGTVGSTVGSVGTVAGSGVTSVTTPVFTTTAALGNTVTSATTPVSTVLGTASNALTSGNLASGVNTVTSIGPRLPISTP